MITSPGHSGGAVPLRRFARDAMACTFEVYLVARDAEYARQAADAAFDEVARLEQELSRFVPISDISRINALPAGLATSVCVETFECLELALRVFNETEGAFDVTFGSAVEPPEDGRAKSAIHALEFDPKQRLVGVRADGVAVDLGGLGKGYAVDQMVVVLRDWSVSAGLIQSGQSTVYALGTPPDADAWSVALRSPVDQEQSLGRVILRDAALSGSGQLLHGHHIIDPRSGAPADAHAAAWARAPSAALADALSTAFMVMSADAVEAYCRQHPDVSAILAPQGLEARELLRFGVEIA